MKQPKMNVKRLERLHKELKSLRPAKHRQFDMNNWFMATVSMPEISEIEIDARGVCKVKAVKPECGTSACALGHAAMIPEFQRAGLRLKVDSGLAAGLRLKVDSGLASCGETSGHVRFGRLSDVEAGAKFFGLTRSEAGHLFLPEYYAEDPVTPRHVVEHIDEVLSGKLREEASE